ncbi:MAG: protein-disulfide reductase DsbD [Xanthomonadales bacterium]|nr:protein-disulfide reductase DsbD [Gammaproteobacteria bacterium]NNL05945.1 protein-disulfide reductase DsbD [Xanthomonadales bacterium]
MNRKLLNTMRAGLVVLLAAVASPAPAIDFDDVRDFEDVFVISAEAPGRDRVVVRWAIEDGYYLYNNKFLRFRSDTAGVVLGEPEIPPGETGFDELLGEVVEKYHEELVVTVPLVSVEPGVDRLQLKVRSQGCLEDELCYPPTTLTLELDLPSAADEAAPFDNLLAGDYRPPALNAEEAFVYESIGFDAVTALARFTIEPGYYLYRDQFIFRVKDNEGVEIRGVALPEGVVKDDPEFGPVPVFYGQVEIPVSFERFMDGEAMVTLEAQFQGCRDGDICYPPMSRSVSFTLPADGNSAGPVTTKSDTAIDNAAVAAAPVSDQDRLAGLLTRSPVRAIIAFFIAGLLLAFTPCVLPMLPILSGIIVGQGEKITTMRAFWLSLIYVMAMAVTYTAAGVLAGLFGQNLQAMFQNPWVISGFVLIFILLALSMFGFYELQLPSRLQTRLAEASNRQRGGQWVGVAVMGFLSALIVGPCVAPPLMAALIVIGSSGDAVLGGAALFAMAMGMGVPLILFGISAGKLVPRAGGWMDAVKAVFGVGLLALSIWMLERILPGGVIMLMWGALAIACGVYLGALESLGAAATGWRKFWKSAGLILLLIGILEIVGAAAGGDDWLKPLGGFRAPASGAAATGQHAEFKRVKSLQDLDQALDAGRGSGTMFDFYADWCIECKRMERNTFPAPRVAALMDELQLLQADVTANDAVDQALMRRFGVIGPPAILFFDRNGEEMEAYRLVGYFAPDEFAEHLEQVLAAR